MNKNPLLFLLLTLAISASALADNVAYKHFDASAVESRNMLADVKPYGFGKGYEALEDGSYKCNNPDGEAFGLRFPIQLNQTVPEPIIATAESRCEGVESASSGDYSIYMDIAYADGTYQWGVSQAFPTGSVPKWKRELPKSAFSEAKPCPSARAASHNVGQKGKNWSSATVRFMPEKPIKSLTMYLLFRNRQGTVWFRNPSFKVVTLKSPDGSSAVFPFDEELVLDQNTVKGDASSRYYFREFNIDQPDNAVGDVVLLQPMDSDSVWAASGIEVTRENGKTVVRNQNGKTRSITLIRAVKMTSNAFVWYGTMDEATVLRKTAEDGAVEQTTTQIEFSNSQHINAGANRLARFPIAGVGLQDGSTRWIGIAPDYPAVYRFFYNDRTKELCIAYDLAFTPEKSLWVLSDVDWTLAPQQSKEGYRSAWAEYMRLFPKAFFCHLPRNDNGEPILGNWMPFLKVSSVEGWEDFAFRFMEGTGNEKWDDEHGILTYRYTEPMTWWMHMSKDLPRTMDSALAEVKRQAENGSEMAKTWENCVMRDRDGNPIGRLEDTPWCFGCVWSMDSVPTVPKPNQFSHYWRENHVTKNYPSDGSAPKFEKGFEGLDGEYIDSSEGYVTAELDFAPAHLSAADRPLTFDPVTKRPAVYRGLVTFEYIRALSQTVRASGKSMMANSTPHQLTWLVPLCDVLGTETNWNWNDQWRPSSPSDLLRKRALCGEKPFCFLQNTDFTKFSYEHSEKFMKRSLAFGMFPGYFSSNASTGHYFSQPELYNRDRPLFKKYMPVILAVAQAGWQPERLVQVENVDNDSRSTVCCERFASERNTYITFFNPEQTPQTVRVTIPKEFNAAKAVLGTELKPTDVPGVYKLTLNPEDVAVYQLEK